MSPGWPGNPDEKSESVSPVASESPEGPPGGGPWGALSLIVSNASWAADVSPESKAVPRSLINEDKSVLDVEDVVEEEEAAVLELDGALACISENRLLALLVSPESSASEISCR
jgi:hypothetical protein